MQLKIKDNTKLINCFYSESITGLNKAIYQIDAINNNLNATLIIDDKKITCEELLGLKELLLKSNIKLTNIYSSSRESVITAKYLQIDGNLSKKYFDKFTPKIEDPSHNKDITHFGMVRSGDQISSNGNLFVLGDVNPGAQISAKKNIYVWGKLSGVAFAGKNGINDSIISALFLNALQLRINETIAIGPKEKPKSNCPEIALIEKGKIVIKPLLINS